MYRNTTKNQVAKLNFFTTFLSHVREKICLWWWQSNGRDKTRNNNMFVCACICVCDVRTWLFFLNFVHGKYNFIRCLLNFLFKLNWIKKKIVLKNLICWKSLTIRIKFYWTNTHKYVTSTLKVTHLNNKLPWQNNKHLFF